MWREVPERPRSVPARRSCGRTNIAVTLPIDRAPQGRTTSHGRRVSVPEGTTEITMADEAARGFDAVQAYRPSSECCSDGVELWELYTDWSSSGPAPLI